MLKGIMALFLGVALTMGSPLMALAQGEVEVDFESGNVIAFSAESLTIKSFEDAEREFVINAETVLENIVAMDELNAGDTVYIDFIEADGQNIALNIFKSSGTGTYDEGSLEGSGEDLYQDLGDEQEEKE